MNRENKLALIIGFTLILVVGVLVSDHLSRANSMELGEGPELSEGTYRQPISGGIINDTIAANLPPRQFLQNNPVNAGVDSSGQGLSPQHNTLALNNPSPMLIDQGSDGAPGALDRLADAIGNTSNRILDIYQNSAMPVAVELDQDGPRSVMTEPQNTIPTTISHRVRESENLFRLAERYLGDGERWREIRDQNPGVVGAEGQVGVGASLSIRILEQVSGSPRPRTSRPALNETPRSIDVDGPTTREYIVKANDVLGTIAQRELGTVRRINEIIELNDLSDRDTIWVGMKLKLPAR